MEQKEKFATQADPKVLAAVRQIAEQEGRQLQAVIDEALRDYIAKKQGMRPRAHMVSALQDSMADFSYLYQKLAE